MEKTEAPVKVGISIGDLNGIGSEIILRSFEDPRMLDFCTPVLYANKRVVSFLIRYFKVDFRFNPIRSAEQAAPGKFNLVNVWEEPVNVDFGNPDPETGHYAFLSLQAATKDLKIGDIDTLVTAPINKKIIQSEQFDFPGHTDYLAQELAGDSLMFMLSKELKIGLLTDHIALKKVSTSINEAVIRRKIQLMEESLRQDFTVQKPRIAVLGINPHTGDQGVIGDEDDKVLRPVIKAINEGGQMVYGPYAGDSFFGSGNYKNFHGVIAAYHDQGLIPFKTLSFGKGVNFTAGLSRVRTSPDHGTAYEIAGRGVANISSFKAAIFKGIEIFRNRKEYKELSKNPLPKHSQKNKKSK